MGWEFLCSLNVPTYSGLVREFYNNAKVGVGSVTSEVKGVKIDLDIESLSHILHMPTI